MAGEVLSPIFDRPGIAGFTFMRYGEKFPPIEEGWQHKGHSFEEAAAYQGNIGLLAGNRYGGLDQDDLAAFEGLTLPETTTWETRPGRLGMWLVWSDNVAEVLGKYGFKADQSQIHLHDPKQITGIDKKGREIYKHVGEVKIERAYQLIPPSWKTVDGQRVNYRMLNVVPPAEVSLEWLLSGLLRIGLSFSEKSKEPKHVKNAAKLEQKRAQAASRIGDVKAKAREFLQQALSEGIPGNRNKTGFWLACQLRDLGMAAGEASEYLRSYARGVPKGDHSYTEDDALDSLRQAYSREPRDPPKSAKKSAEAPNVLTLEELQKRFRDDPKGSIKDPQFLASLAYLRESDSVEYDLFLQEIKSCKALKGIRIESVRALVDKHAQKAKGLDMPEAAEDIKEIAKGIIKRGEAYEYIIGVWQKRVRGNKWLGKALLISRGVQSCRNTKGIQVYAHGKHGHGKSEGMKEMAKLIPQPYILDEDISPMSLYYATKEGWIVPGATIFPDDINWNDSLGGVIKKITTKFQEGAGHLTVIDGVPVRMHLPPRLSIWTNSADLHADEQLRDRFLDAPVDEGLEQVKGIIEFQKRRDTLPEAPGDAERETAICQEILRDLATHLFIVKIPFSPRIRFPPSEGTRGYNIFSDLIKGLAALRYAKRETDEKGQLLATIEDYEDAKELYEGINGHSENRYATAERTVLKAIIDNGHKALIDDIRRLTSLSEGRIKDIINGRGKDEQKRHGLRYKCPQLEAKRVDISIMVNETERRTIHPLEYSLPETFKLADVGDELITLEEEENDSYNHSDVADVDPDVVCDVGNNNNSKDRDVVDVVKEKRDGDNTDDPSNPYEDIASSLSEPKTTSNTSLCQSIAKDRDVVRDSHYVSYVTMAADAEKGYVTISEQLGDKEIRNKDFGTNETACDEKPLDGDSSIESLQLSLTPPQKYILWSEAARLIRKNYCRTYKGIKGFTVEDLEKETGLPANAIRATLEAAGWPKTDEPCGTIFWATEKALKAMGFEVKA